MKGIVEEHGINDMKNGWINENKLNYKIYKLWSAMLRRVYSEKVHENFPNYTDVTLQLEFHWLSYFAEHIQEIEGYDKEKFLNNEIELDKDIKSNGKIKEYSIDNCMFVNHKLNSKQAQRTRDDKYGHLHEEHRNKIKQTMIANGTTKGKNNPRSKRVTQYDLNNNLIKIWDYVKQVTEKFGWDNSSICKCCNGKQKTAYGYIWKYVEED